MLCARADDVIHDLRAHAIGLASGKRLGAADHVHHRARLLVDIALSSRETPRQWSAARA